jgi:SAM-dependent methyltransferase
MPVNNEALRWNVLSNNRRKWEKVIHSFLDPITQRLMRALLIFDDMQILDVATGTGEPGLTIASSFPNIKVTGTDISESMITIARQKAATEHIGNYTAICCDVSSMPFPDNAFDAILCRNGVMFFNDTGSGLAEMYRVLKPGGSMRISTWGYLQKNLWIGIVLNTISKITGQKVFRRNVPGMFYCMEPGFMTEWMELNNLQRITEKEVTGIVCFNSIMEYWQYVTTVSTITVEAVSKLNAQTVDAVYNEIQSQLHDHIIDGKLYIQWASNITIGYK